MLRYSVIYSTPLQEDRIILNYQVADLIAQLVLHLDRRNIIQIQYRITRKADQVVGTLPQSCYPRDGQRLKVKGQLIPFVRMRMLWSQTKPNRPFKFEMN